MSGISTRSRAGAGPPGETASLSKTLGFPETRIELGMTHPGVRRAMTTAGGTTGFLIRLDDDRITDLEVEIGLGHRGFEKQVESAGFAGALPYVARLGYAGGVVAETAYCLAIESLLEVPLPDRAIWLRMLANEAARVTDHFARLAGVMSAIGLRDAETLAARAELSSARLLAAATGRGPFGGWLRIGGVASALPDDFPARWTETRALLEKDLARFVTLAISNPTAQRRLRGVAGFGREESLAWGVTGPSLRAAGEPGDVRRDRPYLAYAALDFEVPVGETGDDYDRLLVVVEEIRQSLGMIEQCHKLLTSLGPGVIQAEALAAEAADPAAACEVPAGEALATVEGTTGALSFWVVSDGTPRPVRVRCRAPSFFHAQALERMMRGARLDDLLPTAALLHLVSAECDR